METNYYKNVIEPKFYFTYWIKFPFLFIVVASVIFCLPSATAQTIWSPPGAVWHYSYSPMGAFGTGYIRIENVGDTIIMDKECKKLAKSLYWYDFITHEFSSEIFGFEYTYSNEDKVLIFKGNQFYTLYDFSAQPGDSWTVPGISYYEGCDTIGSIHVDSIGTMIINNTELRYLCVSPDISAPNWGWAAAKIVERIGPVKTYYNTSYDYFFPIKLDYCGMGMGEEIEGGFFRCYSDSTLFNYSSQIVPTCDYIETGVEEPSLQKIVVVTPNPFSQSITISIDMPFQDGNLSIYSAEGQLVKQMPIQQNFYQYDLTNLTKGVYFLTLRINQHFIYKKILKL